MEKKKTSTRKARATKSVRDLPAKALKAKQARAVKGGLRLRAIERDPTVAGQ